MTGSDLLGDLDVSPINHKKPLMTVSPAADGQSSAGSKSLNKSAHHQRLPVSEENSKECDVFCSTQKEDKILPLKGRLNALQEKLGRFRYEGDNRAKQSEKKSMTLLDLSGINDISDQDLELD